MVDSPVKTSDGNAGSTGAPEILRPSASVRKRILRPDMDWRRSIAAVSVKPWRGSQVVSASIASANPGFTSPRKRHWSKPSEAGRASSTAASRRRPAAPRGMNGTRSRRSAADPAAVARHQKTIPRLAEMKYCCGRKTCLSNQGSSQRQAKAKSASALAATAPCASLRNMSRKLLQCSCSATRTRARCAGGPPSGGRADPYPNFQPVLHPRDPGAGGARPPPAGHLLRRRERQREVYAGRGHRNRCGVQRRGWKQELQLRHAPFRVRVAHRASPGARRAEAQERLLPPRRELLQRRHRGRREPRCACLAWRALAARAVARRVLPRAGAEPLLPERVVHPGRARSSALAPETTLVPRAAAVGRREQELTPAP